MFTWTFSGAPVTVRLPFPVVDEIRDSIAAGRFSACLLLGNVFGRTVHITRLRALKGFDQPAVEAALLAVQGERARVVGFARLETGPALALGAGDVETANACFSDPHSIALLIQPGTPPNATFFFREGGRFLGDFAFLEFPFDSALLKLEARPAVIELPNTPSSAPGSAAAAPDSSPRPAWRTASRPRAWGIAAAVTVLLAGAAAAGVWFGPRLQAGGLGAAAPALSPARHLGLQAQRSGSEFLLTWDRSAAAGEAVTGVLRVQDGARVRELPLGADQVRRGSILLEPSSDQVDVRLSLRMPDGSVQSESVMLLLVQGADIAVEARATAIRPKPDPGDSGSAYTGAVPVSRVLPMGSSVRTLADRETRVDVRVSIDQKGAVTAARALPQNGVVPAAGSIAEQAARSWRFHPATRDGEPVAGVSVIRFVFKPKSA